MKKCYLCLVPENEAVLYEGIHKVEGRVHVCRKCYFKSKIPLIEKKEIDLEEVQNKGTIRERLLRFSKFKASKEEKEEVKVSPKDRELKGIVEANFKKEVALGPKGNDDLVDNFNWIIMRRRRSKKLTQGEFAKEIMEPLVVIQSLEKGILPRDYLALVKKVEAYLGIRILKKSNLSPVDIITESRVPSGILLGEIKRASPKIDFSQERVSSFGKDEVLEEKEEMKETFSPDSDYVDPNSLTLEKVKGISGIVPKARKKVQDLSDEDINKIIFGN